ncbi:LysM peptidoglycan-binding domain-containing protein [Gulosibacter sp. 10]|uniref:LysM peptidoglycan-binding domain-containing protein n=1 Tax=Gulosibacter sp. 10 TaxID=1255570 RepID=UPI00097F232A|nr:LysM peptidoglycan-binding domain-containing protein [Gulosibacter sp. 10]SJM61478.1 peptidase M15B and M15C, D,D-carboxypeptidase VanY/endolysins [Gulosibacter sp. 10]
MVKQNIGYPNGDPRNATGTARWGGKSWSVRKEAAPWLEALARAFKARFGYELPVLEAHRSLAEQRRLYDGWVNRRPGFNLAAVPGTSNHGWGLAVDFGSPLNLTSSAEHKWMLENAPKYGWWWAGGQSWWSVKEPWHFEFDGRNTRGKIPPKATSSTIGTYTTRKGDTLRKIAVRYRMSVAALARLNSLKTDATLTAGRKLKVETKWTQPYGTGKAGTYKVTTWPDGIYYLKKGDTQRSVAVAHKMSVAALRRANGMDEEKGFMRWPAGLGVRVKLSHLPVVYRYLDGPDSDPVATAQVQHRLKTVYPSYAGDLVVDGIYGPATAAAVQEFQRRTPGLGASAKVDSTTWSALFGGS